MKNINTIIMSFIKLAETELEKSERQLMNERFKQNRNDPVYKEYIKRIVQKQKSKEQEQKLLWEKEQQRLLLFPKPIVPTWEEKIERVKKEYKEERIGLLKEVYSRLPEIKDLIEEKDFIELFWKDHKYISRLAAAKIAKDDKKINLAIKEIVKIIKNRKTV